MNEQRVAIVGSGPVALVCALAARAQKIAPWLYWRAWTGVHAPIASDVFDQRVYALNAASRELLQTLGVWRALEAARVTPIHRMRVWSGSEKNALSFDALDARCEALAWIVEHRALMDALVAVARTKAIKFNDTEAFSSLDRTTVAAVLLADGITASHNASLGLSVKTTPYRHSALVFNVRRHAESGASHNEALQIFGPNCAPKSVIACLPLPNGQATIVWSGPDEVIAELNARDDAALTAAVCASFDLPPIASALTSSRQIAPLRLSLPTQIVRDRAALVGDAAHALHPMAGQGLNLGLADVAQLQSLWANTPDPGHPLLLSRYARARLAPTLAMQSVTDALWRSFSGAWPWSTVLRHGAFSVVETLPFVKLPFVRQAFGATVARTP